MKTIVATGCTSGLGLSALSTLLSTTQVPLRIILGSRAIPPTQAQSHLDAVKSTFKHDISCHQLELGDLKSVRGFAQAVKEAVEKEESEDRGIDVLLLSAAMYQRELKIREGSGGWCEEAIVNHFSQHYLTLLLEPLLRETTTQTSELPRIVVVSSAKHTSVKSVDSLPSIFRDASYPVKPVERYFASKFVQLVGAKALRKGLLGRAEVVAVSPGFVPTSGLNRDEGYLGWFLLHYVLSWASFATSLSAGGEAIVRAINVSSKDLEDEEAFPYYDKNGNKTPIDSRILEGGVELEKEWAPTKESIESWFL